MKKPTVCFISILLLLSCNRQGPLISEQARPDPSAAETDKIEIFQPVEINGTEQWILAKGNNPDKPVLLYLHGGPGQSQIPFAHYVTDPLADDFITVHWDQRGTGLSLNGSVPPASMNIGRFLDDTEDITKYLLAKFNKKKLFLLGHSWGSIIGLYSVKRNPGLYHAYIGVGQVISPKESARVANSWLLEKAGQNESDLAEIRRAMDNGFASRAMLLKYGGILHGISVESFKAIRSSTPYRPEMYTDELYQRGLEFSAYRMNDEISGIDFRGEIRSVDVPVYFFCGSYDYVAPSGPVIDYCESLKAPHREIVRFGNSGHRPDVEEAVKFRRELTRIGSEVLRFAGNKG